MFKTSQGVLLVAGLILGLAVPLPAGEVPGELKFPDQYRKWVYLTSGFDMTYTPSIRTDNAHTFDNVFVNPEAYESFLKAGTWPDGTMLVLEVREGRGIGSINRAGSFQGERTAVEVHVKDEAHFAGKWGFFGFEAGATPSSTAKVIPPSADCYSCHAEHGAVDTTFVQFYPTLLPVAREKGTLTGTYWKERRSTK